MRLKDMPGPPVRLANHGKREGNIIMRNRDLTIRSFVLAVGFGVVLLAPSATAFADPGPDSPTATHDNPSSCLGAERATRNSAGGDRAQGGFGPGQSEFVRAHQPYGQWLLEDLNAIC